MSAKLPNIPSKANKVFKIIFIIVLVSIVVFSVLMIFPTLKGQTIQDGMTYTLTAGLCDIYMPNYLPATAKADSIKTEKISIKSLGQKRYLLKGPVNVYFSIEDITKTYKYSCLVNLTMSDENQFSGVESIKFTPWSYRELLLQWINR